MTALCVTNEETKLVMMKNTSGILAKRSCMTINRTTTTTIIIIIITLFKCQMYLALSNVLTGDTVNK